MAGAAWIEPSELRVGLGCMRLWSADDGAPHDSAESTVAAALAAGITVFDTARTYDGPEHEAGGNERALSRLLRAHGHGQVIRIITKGGMRREGTAWIPDGRARTVLGDCEASLAALDGLPIGVYLLHAPDPSTAWKTSLRALVRLLDEGLVSRVGLSNVSRAELEQALGIVPVSAVEISVNPFDDSRLRDGTIALCAEHGITVIAHSPLGGPRRARSVPRNATLRGVADARDAAPAEMALAWLLDVAENIVAIPGARRAATARSAAAAATLRLADNEREALRSAFGGPRTARRQPLNSHGEGDVVLVMGIPGAGKSRLAAGYEGRGYERLNRDLRGGSMRELCAALEDALTRGARTVVLDNTWLTRAIRSRAIEIAAGHGVAIRCVWLDISLADAQRNVVERVVELRESLPSPEEVRQFNGRDGMLSPTAQMRALRELEPPMAGEGFTDIERVAFVRETPPPGGVPGVFIAASAAVHSSLAGAIQAEDARAPRLVFDWKPDGDTALLDHAAAAVRGLSTATVDAALCAHPAGPPVCWCRPHLLGLVLHFAHNRGVDASTSVLVGTSSTHRSMAASLGCRFIGV